ncbi:hypothetical protein Q3G72_032374 [Acer saccharum]|nr:hypothetical protein Q3G72_027364 [Acer saccharum]KAK1589286.1 hypothetical protein Q3G72_032374 [Acer saccharum]
MLTGQQRGVDDNGVEDRTTASDGRLAAPDAVNGEDCAAKECGHSGSCRFNLGKEIGFTLQMYLLLTKFYVDSLYRAIIFR